MQSRTILSIVCPVIDYPLYCCGTKTTGEYNSFIRQNRVRAYHQEIKRFSIKQKGKRDATKGLKLIRILDARYKPQDPMLYQPEEAKVEYFYSSVIGLNWATPVLTQGYASYVSWTCQ